VWTGGFATALLFVGGKTLIAAWLARSSVGSAWGAAGSVFLFLVWLYYSAPGDPLLRPLPPRLSMAVTTTLAVGQFFGQVRRRHDAGGITLAETTYPRGWAIPRHDHGHPFLCLVLAGSVTEEVEGAPRRELGPRGVFFHPGGLPHAERIGRDATRLFSIQLSAGWLGELASQGFAPPEQPVVAERGRGSWRAGHLYHEFERADPATPLVADDLVLAALADLLRLAPSRLRGRRPAWLGRVVDLLHATCHRPPSLAALAREAGVHPMHLARAFRHHLGCSVGEMARQIRIDEACRRIAGGESLARVAAATGFADQSHFSRAFRQVVGTTPGRFRARLAGPDRA
jgi:AraC family transcriptional regulator